MSTLVNPGTALKNPTRKSSFLRLKLAAFAVLLLIAIAFVGKYVFRYYLHYNQAAFTDPQLGAANYWTLRAWLLLHITGGMVALLAGPWQFWTGFRARYLRVHRFMGTLFLCGVAMGVLGAIRLAVGTTFGWAFGFALLGLASAWTMTAGMAYYAVRQGQIEVHKEWMVRAYVVTFAFVTFRILNDYGLLSRFGPDSDRSITIAWSCWVIPLMFTELVLQFRRVRKAVASSN